MNATFLHTLRGKTRGNGHRKPGKNGREYTARLEALVETAEKASSIPEIVALLDNLLEMAQKLTGATASSLLMVDEEHEALHFLVAEGEAGSQVQDMNVSLDSGICGWVARNGKPVLINNVDEDARFDRSVDDLTGFVTISMIAVPLFRGRRVIGVLEAINKQNDRNFTEADQAALEGYSASPSLIMLVSMMATIVNNIRAHQLMIDWYKSMFETLIGAIDAKDPYAQGHSKRVKEISLRVARVLKLPPEELQVIEMGALLHDIGKIDIHDIVLRKAGPLTEEEMYTMRKHALRGTNLLIEIPFLEKVRDIVLFHHERYDGKGYPNGLKGSAIPLRARIVAAAEALDTMTTDRAYREKLSLEEALEELKKGSGTQFCPTVVKAFRTALGAAEEENEAAAPAEAAPVPDFAPPLAFGLPRREVRLVVRAGDDVGALRQLRRGLEKIENLKVLMDSRSEAEGTIFIVSVRETMNLPAVLGELPVVTAVAEDADTVMVTVKTPPTQKVFKQGFNLDWRP